MNANDGNQQEINYDNHKIQEEVVKVGKSDTLPKNVKMSGLIWMQPVELRNTTPLKLLAFCVKETYMFQLSVNSTP